MCSSESTPVLILYELLKEGDQNVSINIDWYLSYYFQFYLFMVYSNHSFSPLSVHEQQLQCIVSEASYMYK